MLKAVLVTAAGLATQFGTERVVLNAIRATTPRRLRGYAKIATKIGKVVVPMASGVIASTVVEREVAAACDGVANIKDMITISRDSEG